MDKTAQSSSFLKRRFLGRPSPAAVIAIGNLAAVAVVLLVHGWIFPGDVIAAHKAAPWEPSVDLVMSIVLAVLTFPVGWLAELSAPLGMPPVMIVVCVPLNGYFWGHAVMALRYLRSDRGRSKLHGKRCLIIGGAAFLLDFVGIFVL